MEYDIVSYKDLDIFINLVNAKLSEGWVPVGGVVFYKELDTCCIITAIISVILIFL